jgi:hypothetical protein
LETGSSGRLERLALGLSRALVAAGAVAAGTFLWRTLTWPAAASPDAWAYVSWGETLLHGDRLGYELTSTAPKPLGGILGALVSPLPPERALGVVVALALGVLVAALFVAAEKRAGSAAGALAVVLFVAAAHLSDVLAYQFVDTVAAALVAIALATRGRARVLALVICGLLRPEAWALAGVAAHGEAKTRRLLAAAIATVAAPALWVAYDALVTGDPLATPHRTDDLLAPAKSWAGALESVADRISPVGFVLVALAVLGFAFRARRNGGDADLLLPIATMVVWPLALVIEADRGLPIPPRYLLPPLVAVALGISLLVPRVAPRWVAAAAATAAVLVFALTMDFGAERWAQQVRAIEATAPSMEGVLDCGTVGIAGVDPEAGAYIGALAAATRRSLHEFAHLPSALPSGGVLRLQQGDFTAPSGWRRRSVPLGSLFVSPQCQGN